jgi:hypothetical protein
MNLMPVAWHEIGEWGVRHSSVHTRPAPDTITLICS